MKTRLDMTDKVSQDAILIDVEATVVILKSRMGSR